MNRILVAVLCVFGVVIGARLMLLSSVQTAMPVAPDAKVSDAGHPTTRAEIEARRTPVRPGERTIYAAFDEVASRNDELPMSVETRLIGQAYNMSSESWLGEIDPALLDAVQAFVENRRELIEPLYDLPKLAGRPQGVSDDYEAIKREEDRISKRLVRVARICVLDAWLGMREGDVARASRDARALLAVLRPFEETSHFAVSMADSAILRKLQALTEAMIGSSMVGEDDLRMLADAYAALHDGVDIRWMLWGELPLAITLADFEQRSPWIPFSARSAATTEEYTQRVNMVLELLTYADDPPGLADLLRNVHRRVGMRDTLVYTVTDHLTNLARLRTAMAAIAVERFRLREGRFPDGLEALVPAYLAAVPDDPYVAGPISSRLSDEGMAVYSRGLNRLDDRGHFGRGKGRMRPLDEGVLVAAPAFRRVVDRGAVPGVPEAELAAESGD